MTAEWDGRPVEPTIANWHWLATLSDCSPVIMLWIAGKWKTSLGIARPDEMGDRWTYLGPAHPPGQDPATWAAAIEAAAGIAKSHHDRTLEWPQSNPYNQGRTETALMILTDLRALTMPGGGDAG